MTPTEQGVYHVDATVFVSQQSRDAVENSANLTRAAS
jgi:hypothetical protein